MKGQWSRNERHGEGGKSLCSARLQGCSEGEGDVPPPAQSTEAQSTSMVY